MTKTKVYETTDIRLVDDNGAFLIDVQIDRKMGPRSMSGALFVERGNGERVSVSDPLGFLAEIWQAGRRHERESGK